MLKSLLVTFGLALSTSSFAGIFPSVVENVELDSFLGRWYEVASTHPSFQKDCVCVTADYSVIDDSTLRVVNTCRKSTIDGPINIADGTAKTTKNSAKLNVSFGGFKLPFSNYWIVELADDYRYAVISTPLRTPVWILSRTSEIDPSDLQGIRERLSDSWFNVDKIKPTLQNSCTYTAE